MASKQTPKLISLAFLARLATLTITSASRRLLEAMQEGHEYHLPVDDDEPTRDNDSEDHNKDPWKCICGQMGTHDDDVRPPLYCEACRFWQHRGCLALPFFEDDDPEHHLCYRCTPNDPHYADLLAARARGERPWVRNMMVHEVLEVVHKKAEWFWTLYSRLNAGNIAAMREGRNLSGPVKGKISAGYRSAAERGARRLLGRLSDGELGTLHGAVQRAAVTRAQVYRLLVEEAERLRAGWEGCEEELEVFAELFVWVPKKGKSK